MNDIWTNIRHMFGRQKYRGLFFIQRRQTHFPVHQQLDADTFAAAMYPADIPWAVTKRTMDLGGERFGWSHRLRHPTCGYFFRRPAGNIPPRICGGQTVLRSRSVTVETAGRWTTMIISRPDRWAGPSTIDQRQGTTAEATVSPTEDDRLDLCARRFGDLCDGSRQDSPGG